MVTVPPGGEDSQAGSPPGQRARPAPGAGIPKIFGIGLSRTGTTSLTGALNLLGFPAIHYPTHFHQIDANAAATDITVSLAFEKLDRFYPGSYFVVTTRALEPWLESCERMWKKNAEVFPRNSMVMEVEKQFYGGDGYDRQRYIDCRERHLSAVAVYFRDRPADILYLDLFEDPQPWQTLCPFIRVNVPDLPFPHQNRSDLVDRILLRLLEALGDAGKVARLTLVSEEYLSTLSVKASGSASAAPIPLVGGFEEERVLQNSCAVLGIARTASVLGIDPGSLEAYMSGALRR